MPALTEEQESRLRKLELKKWLNSLTRSAASFSPLHFAAFHGNLALIRLFVQHGAKVEETNKDGINMLHVSAQGDRPASIVYCLEKGFDIDRADKNGLTAMHHAAFYGCELSIIYLASCGSSINLPNRDGMTPLHLLISNFSQNKNVDCMKRLLLNGASREIKDK